MNEPTYKGYYAHIVYDGSVDVFFGHICGMSSINFQTNDYDELLPIFHKSVDGYLDFCAKKGTKPREPIAPDKESTLHC